MQTIRAGWRDFRSLEILSDPTEIKVSGGGETLYHILTYNGYSNVDFFTFMSGLLDLLTIYKCL